MHHTPYLHYEGAVLISQNSMQKLFCSFTDQDFSFDPQTFTFFAAGPSCPQLSTFISVSCSCISLFSLPALYIIPGLHMHFIVLPTLAMACTCIWLHFRSWCRASSDHLHTVHAVKQVSDHPLSIGQQCLHELT